MRAIETIGKIDKKGLLQLDKPLQTIQRKVKVIILIPEESDTEDEMLWLSAISTNPAFDFLNDKKEDIYTLSDGKPFND